MAKPAPKNFLRRFSALGLALLVLGALGWLFAEFFMQGHEGWGEWVLEVQFWSLKVHGLGILLYLPALGALAAERWRGEGGGGLFFVLAFLPLCVLSGWLLWYGPSGDLHDRISTAHWGLGILFFASLPFYFYPILGKPKPSRRRK